MLFILGDLVSRYNQIIRAYAVITSTFHILIFIQITSYRYVNDGQRRTNPEAALAFTNPDNGTKTVIRVTTKAQML